MAIALEHVPIADALDSANPDLAASLLASHSNHLVEFLRKEQRTKQTTGAPSIEIAAK